MSTEDMIPAKDRLPPARKPKPKTVRTRLVALLGMATLAQSIPTKESRLRLRKITRAVPGIHREFFRGTVDPEPSTLASIRQSNSSVEIKNLLDDARQFQKVNPRTLRRIEKAAARRLQEVAS